MLWARSGVFTGSCKSKILQTGPLSNEAAMEGGCQRHTSLLKVLLKVVC